MIVLKNVTLTQPKARFPILDNVSLTIAPREKVGILAAPGTGKSSIARLFCGIELPSFGHAAIQNKTWPIGFAGLLHPQLSVGENLSFLADLNGQDRLSFVSRVLTLSKLEGQISNAMRDLTPTQRSVLAYMCTMVLPAQTLVADDKLTVGDGNMRERCEALLQQRLRTSGLIFLSRNLRQIAHYCDRYFALHNGQLIPCDSPIIAQSILTPEQEIA